MYGVLAAGIIRVTCIFQNFHSEISRLVDVGFDLIEHGRWDGYFSSSLPLFSMEISV